MKKILFVMILAGGLNALAYEAGGFEYEESLQNANYSQSKNRCQQEQQLPLCSSGYTSHCCPDTESAPRGLCGGNYEPVRDGSGHWGCGRIPGGNR